MSVGGSVDASGDARYRKADRLRKRAEFLRVQQGGLRISSGRLMLLSRHAAGERGRVGFTVSKKVGNAVIRGRVKRRLREAWRQNKEAWPKDVDVVVIARPAAKDASWEELVAELMKLAGKIERRRNEIPS